MKRLGDLKDLIPAAVVLVFLGSFAALVLELVVAAARDKAVDSVATTGLFALMSGCIPVLIGLYTRDSRKVDPPPPPPPPPPPRPVQIERTGDPESDRWNEEHGWLQFRWRAGRWKLS